MHVPNSDRREEQDGQAPERVFVSMCAREHRVRCNVCVRVPLGSGRKCGLGVAPRSSCPGVVVMPMGEQNTQESARSLLPEWLSGAGEQEAAHICPCLLVMAGSVAESRSWNLLLWSVPHCSVGLFIVPIQVWAFLHNGHTHLPSFSAVW